jgi:hypothetical protein
MTLKGWLISLLITIPLLAVAGFVLWGLTPSVPNPKDLAALPSDAAVQVPTARG